MGLSNPGGAAMKLRILLADDHEVVRRNFLSAELEHEDRGDAPPSADPQSSAP
jgi:hypothetical protein